MATDDDNAASQNFGEQHNANTGGGDYAEGDIDKRHGEVFVEGSTVHGNVIGKQTNYPTLPMWLRFLSAFAVVVILAVVVLGAVGGVDGIWARLDEWGIMPAITPEQPGETLLVIVPFYYTPNIPNTDAHGEIKRAIQAAAQEAGLTNLRIELAKTALQADDRDRAEQIGAHYNASLVVWGEDTGVRVTVNFLNRRGTPEVEARDVAISETVRTQIANPPAYSRYVTDDLPHQLSFLALFAVGQSFDINQDYDAAIRVIERAVGAVAPETPVEGLAYAYFRLGWLYEGPKRDAAQARVMYDQAITLDPKNARAYNNRGNTRRSQSDLKGALEDYDQALVLEPKYTLAYNNRGNARAEQGDLKGALEDYDQAITLEPKLAAPYANRSIIRFAQGDLKGAIDDLDQAIAFDPKYALAYNNRGNARSAQSDLKGAIADYDQAIALEPNYINAFQNRGIARFKRGDLKGAIADYDQAIALGSKDADVYYNRGVARSAQSDLKGAIADYDQAIALDPRNAPAYSNRGTARAQQGDLEGAIADYDQAIAVDSKNALLYANRGLAYQQQGDRTQAIADFEQVLRLTDNVEVRRKAEAKLRELYK
jgi:tetratricopeptide (TPR) repeat protein